jgi:DNA-binding transcriptional regulator YhcF (GntR family)
LHFRVTRGVGRPLQDQLSAQILLGILSGKFQPGEKLPSLKQLSRVLRVHSNSIGIVYRDLIERGWLESRPGSGVYVTAQPRSGIDSLMAAWLEAAAAQGITSAQIRDYLDTERKALPKLVIDPDAELARILAAELSELLHEPVRALSLAGATAATVEGSEVWCNPGRIQDVRQQLGEIPLKQLKLRSIDQILGGIQRPVGPFLVAIVSASESIRTWALLLLPALGINSDSVVLRNPREEHCWQGLSQCAVIGVDILAERNLPSGLPSHPIRIVSL